MKRSIAQAALYLFFTLTMTWFAGHGAGREKLSQVAVCTVAALYFLVMLVRELAKPAPGLQGPNPGFGHPRRTPAGVTYNPEGPTAFR